MPEVRLATQQEHETVIRAIFGSVQRYEESDHVKQIDERLDFLVKLRNNLEKLPEWELKQIRWWQLYNWLLWASMTLVFLPMMSKEVERLIDRYRSHRPLAIPFIMTKIDEEYQQFNTVYANVIAGINQHVDKEKK